MMTTTVVMSVVLILAGLSLLLMFFMPKDMRRNLACVLLFLGAVIVSVPRDSWPEGTKGFPFLDSKKLGLDIDLAGGAMLVYRVDLEEEERRIEDLHQQIALLEQKAGAGTMTKDESRAYDEATRTLEALQRTRAVDDPVSSTISVLQRRLDPDGVRGVRIEKVSAENKLQVTLPGFSREETDEYDRLIRQQGVLKFALHADEKESNATFSAKKPSAKDADGHWPVSEKLTEPDSTEYYQWYPGEAREQAGKKPRGFEGTQEVWEADWLKKNPQAAPTYYLLEFPENEKDLITGADLLPESIREEENIGSGEGVVISYQLSEEAGERFGQLTSANKNEPLAIVLDNVVKATPTIKSRITTRGQLTGFRGPDRARIVKVLRAGSLKVKLTKESGRFVGPSEGQDSIDKGLRSVVWALAAVFVFMLAYYLGGGIIGSLTLVFNGVLILGVMNLFQITLSMPGIAGLILTMGMAVDANILIFERVREERERGVSLKSAIDNGFARAFWAIFDSNITTLMTGLILYWIGIGPIRGFAVTLCIGIVCSVFSALVVTRALFQVALARKWLTQFRMLKVLSKPKFRFVSGAKYAVPISVGLIGFGLYTAWQRGAENFGLDFRGGDLVHLQFDEAAAIGDVRQSVLGFERQGRRPYKNCEVQSATSPWDQGALPAGQATQFVFRNPGDADEERQAQFNEDLEAIFADRLVEPGLSITMAVPPPKAGEAADRNGTVVGEYRLEVGPKFSAETVREQVQRALEEKALVPQKAAVEAANASVQTELSALDQRIAALERERADQATSEQRKQELAAEATLLRQQRGAKQQLRHPTPTLQVTPATVEVGSGKQKFDVIVQSVDFQVIEYFALVEAIERHNAELLRRDEGVTNFEAKFHTQRQADLAVSAHLLQPVRVEVIRTALESAMRSAADGSSAGGIQVGAVRVIAAEGTEQAATALSITLENCAFTADEKSTPQAYVTRLTRRLQMELDTQDSALRSPTRGTLHIDPRGAEKLRDLAIWALLFANVAIMIYIRFRFLQWRFGLAAVVALLHDVLFTIGAMCVAAWYFGYDIQFNFNEVAAILTIIGYSINDTIVIFDRIRENLARRERPSFRETLDQALNQTLSRTVFTAFTTFIVVLVLFIWGGKILESFSLAMIIGVVVGTYSSLFIATPLLAMSGERLAKEVQEELDRKKEEDRETTRLRGSVGD